MTFIISGITFLKEFVDRAYNNNVDFQFEINGHIFGRVWLMADGILP
jgi:hypothetical protein